MKYETLVVSIIRTSRLSRKQHSLKVPRAVKDVQNFNRGFVDAKEDQIITMHTASNACVLPIWQEWESAGHVREFPAFGF